MLEKLGPSRQIDSQDNPKRRQPTRRSGRDPGSRPYAPITSRSGKPHRKHYPHSPCRFSLGLGATATLTFLFTDIEGSTALLGRLGEATYARLLAEHHRLIRGSLAAHDGNEITTLGDGFFAVFTSPRACVRAVLEMQRELAARQWPEGEQVRVRMGVHSGEASETAAGLVGLDVHRAARLAGVAYGGQVVLSSSAAALVRDRFAGRGVSQRPRAPPFERSGTARADLPVAGRRSCVGVPAVAFCRPPGPGKQPPGPASHVRRARAGAVRAPPLGGGRPARDAHRGRRGRQDEVGDTAGRRAPRRLGRWGVARRARAGVQRGRGRLDDPRRSRDGDALGSVAARHPGYGPGVPAGFDRARQLRAPHRRLREGRRRHLAPEPRDPSAGDQP